MAHDEETKLLNDTMWASMTHKLTPAEEKAEQDAIDAVMDFTFKKICEAGDPYVQAKAFLCRRIPGLALAEAKDWLKRQKKKQKAK